MQRYLLELSYKGTNYSGFQVQDNAVTIQSEVQKALKTLFKTDIELTGSSRTDAGVHALQNFFHFDNELAIRKESVYNLNAILPVDIAVLNLYTVPPDFHARFSALSRTYHYFIYRKKNPFKTQTAWHYPFQLELNQLQEAATIIKAYTDFTSFSKRNTQVKSFECSILESHWSLHEDGLMYTVTANRFLRGMVRGLVATMLKVGRGSIDMEQFHQIITAKDCTKADFSAPAHGLFLVKVAYPSGILV